MNIAVVTGASSGMGKEFVYQISSNFKSIKEIWVIARRKERLDELKEQVEELHSDTMIRVLPLDINSQSDLNIYSDLLRELVPTVKLLVNAAGFGMIGTFDEISADDSVLMCDLNCKALTYITKITLPYMDRKQSHIINLASSAAFMPQPSFAVYAASKSYVLSFSRALNKELKGSGISVTAVCPGPVDTEFFDVAQKYKSVKSYKKLFRAKAKDVVSKALLDARKLKDVSVYGTSMRAFKVLSKVLPHRLLLLFIK